jgi:hypothetical protein
MRKKGRLQKSLPFFVVRMKNGGKDEGQAAPAIMTIIQVTKC